MLLKIVYLGFDRSGAMAAKNLQENATAGKFAVSY